MTDSTDDDNDWQAVTVWLTARQSPRTPSCWTNWIRSDLYQSKNSLLSPGTHTNTRHLLLGVLCYFCFVKSALLLSLLNEVSVLGSLGRSKLFPSTHAFDVLHNSLLTYPNICAILPIFSPPSLSANNFACLHGSIHSVRNTLCGRKLLRIAIGCVLLNVSHVEFRCILLSPFKFLLRHAILQES